MFRGKESSNRIKLSQLVQDLLNFGVLGSLWLWEWGGLGGWGLGVVGGCPHTHAHARKCMHAHTHMVNMIISCKWLLPLDFWGIPGNSLWCHMHTCMHACACVGGHSLTTPHPHPPTPQGDPQNQSKFNSTWTNRDISIPFQDLNSVETSPPLGGCIVWWVGGWVSGLMGGFRSKH